MFSVLSIFTTQFFQFTGTSCLPTSKSTLGLQILVTRLIRYSWCTITTPKNYVISPTPNCPLPHLASQTPPPLESNFKMIFHPTGIEQIAHLVDHLTRDSGDQGSNTSPVHQVFSYLFTTVKDSFLNHSKNQSCLSWFTYLYSKWDDR